MSVISRPLVYQWMHSSVPCSTVRVEIVAMIVLHATVCTVCYMLTEATIHVYVKTKTFKNQ